MLARFATPEPSASFSLKEFVWEKIPTNPGKDSKRMAFLLLSALLPRSGSGKPASPARELLFAAAP